MSALVKVPFHDDEIECVQNERGVWVVLRRACESLGLDVDGQRRKLIAKEWAVTELISATGPDGKTYESIAIHLDSVPMWLATIEPSRVAEPVREKLIAYQREAARVLRDHFFGRTQPAVDIPAIASACAAMMGPMFAEMLRAVRSEDESRRLETTTIGTAGHNAIRNALTEAARATTGERNGKRYRSVRQGMSNDLACSFGWQGTGRTWQAFPASRWPEMRVRLEELRRAGERARVRDPFEVVQSVIEFSGKKNDPEAAE